MKREYRSPKVKVVNYDFKEQVVAESFPVSGYADPWGYQRCSYTNGSCTYFYNTAGEGGLKVCDNTPPGLMMRFFG